MAFSSSAVPTIDLEESGRRDDARDPPEEEIEDEDEDDAEAEGDEGNSDDRPLGNAARHTIHSSGDAESSPIARMSEFLASNSGSPNRAGAGPGDVGTAQTLPGEVRLDFDLEALLLLPDLVSALREYERALAAAGKKPMQWHRWQQIFAYLSKKYPIPAETNYSQLRSKAYEEIN